MQGFRLGRDKHILHSYVQLIEYIYKLSHLIILKTKPFDTFR